MHQPIDYPLPIVVGVYGTLKKGQSNHALLSDSRFITNGSTKEEYRLVSMGGFPGMLPGEDSVAVELYEVSDETLSNLDSLEGHPTFYRRTLIPISTPLGTMEAWVYPLATLHSRTPSYSYKNEEGHLDWNKVENSLLYGSRYA